MGAGFFVPKAGGANNAWEQGANMGAVSLGKTGPCWRDRMKKQGSARSEAPTKAPSGRENPVCVGVTG